MKRKIKNYGWIPSLPDPRDEWVSEVSDRAVLPPSYDMRKNSPLPYDQKSLGSCHDDLTEVLTAKGWKLFKDASLEDRFATVNPKTAELIFENPSRIIEIPFDGDLIIGKHMTVDFAVTPDHKMLVRKWDEKSRTLESDYAFVNAGEIGWYAGLLNSVQSLGKGPMDDLYLLPAVTHERSHKNEIYNSEKQISLHSWLKLLGIYLADGCMLKDKDHYGIQIAATKQRKKDWFKELAFSLDLKILEISDRFKFFNKQIFTEFQRLGIEGKTASEKFIPDFIFELPAEYISSFLEGHMAGDGCVTARTKSHYTCSEKMAEGLQRLNFLSGKNSRIKSRPPRTSVINGRLVQGNFPEYRVSVCELRGASLTRRNNIFKQEYSGMVYCAEVPTYHTLVTRRNGHILISGNCTANACNALFQFTEMEQTGKAAEVPSRLYTYWNTRLIQGDTAHDTGASIKDTMKALNQYGVCRELIWPYMVTKFATRPSTKAFAEASKHKIQKYQRVQQTAAAIKGQLAQNNPIAFGFTVFESFEGDELAQTGMMKMPSLDSEGIVGGHAVSIFGYDDTIFNGELGFLIRNSWGVNWGIKGWFWMPGKFLLDPNFASDFWTMSLVPAF